MKHAALAATIALVCAAALAYPATVHVRGGDGEWVEVEAETDGDVLSFTITPEQAAGGRALVVINKPDWMVLDDAEPPRVTGYTVGEETIELGPEGAIDLGALGDDERRITLDVSDNANPIDTGSVALRVTGGADATFTVSEDDPEAHAAVVEVDLGALGPGAYDGAITVADLSPMGNTVELPIRFSVFGLEVAADRQSIRLAAGGAAFTVKGDRKGPVTVDEAGISAFPTIQAGGVYCYVRALRRVSELAPVSGWHLVEVEADLEDIDGNPVTDDEVGLTARLLVGAHPDLPVVVVRTEVTNLGDDRDIYCFWGWLPGASYATPDGETHEWSMQYRDFGHPGWVCIAPTREGEPGVGWISPHMFGESRFGTMILYTDPKYLPTEAGATMDMTFAIMPADGPEAVGEAAEALAQSSIEEFGALFEQ